MKKILTFSFAIFSLWVSGQNQGSLTPEILQALKSKNPSTTEKRALRNALSSTSIDQLAQNADNPAQYDLHFSNEVPSKGITDQQRSGRCWLFTGYNMMRSKVINKYHLGTFDFSHAFSFFYDQLEKSNLFLQSIIDRAKEPIDSRVNTWLFQHPLSDGGTFEGVQAIVMKYGAVPAEIFPESYNANNTSKMSEIISLKLRQYGLELRKMVADKKSSKELQHRKIEQLSVIYHILQICLGTPPEKFTWTLRDAKGKTIMTREFTPRSFYEMFFGKNLAQDYVMMMNDPTRPYYKLYSIDLDRHSYDGKNWTYINLPIEEIKKVAIRSIQDSTMMYISCDVGKFLDRKTGVLSIKNYDYASLFNTDFPMTKAERIETYASASSHAMTLMGVDLDAQGKPLKWKVENSWGANYGQHGHLVITDQWFNEYLFRLVAEKRFVDQKILDILKQKPTLLPAWDPLFQSEQ